MKVKDLISMLQQCDPDADVVLECWQTNEPTLVTEYEGECKLVYIADDMEAVDYDLADEGYIQTKQIRLEEIK